MNPIASDKQKATTADSVKRGCQTSAVQARFSNVGLAAIPEKTCNVIQLLYDSFAQPPSPGTRWAGTGRPVRQMLYRAEPYQIDIQLEAQPDRLVVTGQLIDISRSDMVDVGVQVTISDGLGMVHTVTNQFGEFHGEVNNSGHLELSFLGRDGKSVIILLREALDRTFKKRN